MKRRGIQLSARHKRWFYTVSTVLFLSGVVWVLADRLDSSAEGRNEFVRSARSGSLKLHGAAAMAFLVSLGILIPTHMRRAWHAKRNRRTGVLFVAAIFVLVATGYGLYYFGEESWRSATKWIHLVLGLASPALLGWHIYRGRREVLR